MKRKKKHKRVPPEKWQGWLEEHVGSARVYQPFIEPGDLVFDVGANRGLKTYAMRRLGAKVIAIEPLAGHSSNLVPHLKFVFGDDPNVTIISQAVGAEEGSAEMWAHKIFPGYSSTNWEWSKTRAPRKSLIKIIVPMTTLDKLIERFGEPTFIKVDVEAGEDKVLAGLSRPVAAINFEFHRFLMAVALDCITMLEALGTYQYNYVHAVQDKFVQKCWVSAGKMRDILTALPQKGPNSWGDVYARLQPEQTRRQSVLSELPIDVLIPAVDKDLAILPHAIDGVRENLKHPIKRIIVVAPFSVGIERVCQKKGCEFVWEDSVLPIIRGDINYTVKDLDRSGWLFQQFLKWCGDSLCSEEHYLVLDADTILLRPQVFEIDGKLVLLHSDEHHQPYWDIYRRLFGMDALSQQSFTSHHMLYHKIRIRELKEQIETKYHDSWWNAILKTIDRSEGAAISGYELYGQWMLQNYPNEIIREYWFNRMLRRSQLGDLNRIKGRLASKYRSVTFHSHMQ